MFQIPYGNNLLSFNLSNKRIIYLLSLFIVIIIIIIIIIIIFSCYTIFAHDVLIGIFAMPMVFPPIFYLDRPFGFPI